MVKSGEAFGKTDPNIGKGMPVEKAVDHICKAMTLRIAESTIGGTKYKILYHLGMILPQGVIDYASDDFYKK